MKFEELHQTLEEDLPVSPQTPPGAMSASSMEVLQGVGASAYEEPKKKKKKRMKFKDFFRR